MCDQWILCRPVALSWLVPYLETSDCLSGADLDRNLCLAYYYVQKMVSKTLLSIDLDKALRMQNVIQAGEFNIQQRP